MPPQPQLELPPCGKEFVFGYDKDNISYPIVALHLDQRVGNTVTPPPLGDPASNANVGVGQCPGTTFPTGYFFVGTTQLIPYQRVQWTYRLIPGPWTDPEITQDVDSVNVTTTQRVQFAADIVPGDVVDSGNWIRTRRKDETSIITDEIVITRAVPGNPIHSTTLRDGLEVDVTKTLIVAGTGTTQDEVIGGAEIQHWVEKHEESDQVQWQIDAPAAVFPSQFGQTYQGEFDVVVPFEQLTIGNQTSEPGSPTNRLEITPDNYAKMTTRTVQPPNVAYGVAGSSDFHRVMAAKGNIEVPPVLNQLLVIYYYSQGDGASSGTGTSSSSGNDWLMQLEGSSENQLSVSVTPEVIPSIVYFRGNGLDMIDVFFMAEGPWVLITDVLPILSTIMGSTVLNNPVYDPQEVKIVTGSQKASVMAKAKANIFVSSSSSGGGSSSTGYTKSTGVSMDQDVNVRTIIITPTLHEVLPLSPWEGGDTDSSSLTVTVNAEVNIGGLQDADPATGDVTRTANGGVIPLIDATGVTAPPSSGLYLIDLNCSNYQGGLVAVRARIFDYSILPPY